MLFDAILYSTLLYGTPNSSSRRHLKWDVTTSFFYDRVRAKCFKPESSESFSLSLFQFIQYSRDTRCMRTTYKNSTNIFQFIVFHHQNVIILSSSNKCELNLVLFTTSVCCQFLCSLYCVCVCQIIYWTKRETTRSLKCYVNQST